jgi:ABC-type Fe3+/spermidine/putrescine transport system ATPase subunit
MPEPILQITGIDKSFNEASVLSGISFDVNPGEVIALLGPSGCGKSTLLAIIAGIEKPEHGSIYWMGSRINDLPPHRRGFGLMFQEDVLFPHMDVSENVAFGLKMQKKDGAYIKNKVAETLELVGLQDLGDRNVNTLSGGEQQRVALARSIAPQPGLLMLDEPLSSLDRSLREYLLGEIKRILKELNQTAIYVTHDQEEAFSVSDRVVVMRAGKVEQVGTPEEIYNHPASIFTARFLGFSNLFTGTIRSDDNQNILDTTIGKIPFPSDFHGPFTILIRPDSAVINGTGGIILNGTIVEKTFQGNLCHVVISTNGTNLKFYFLANTDIPEVAEDIQYSINPSGIIPILDTQSGIK